jgi:hypothetical protein
MTVWLVVAFVYHLNMGSYPTLEAHVFASEAKCKDWLAHNAVLGLSQSRMQAVTCDKEEVE